MSFDAPDVQMPALPKAPDRAPIFGQQPANKRPKAGSAQPTFLGGETMPSAGQTGQKSLLGGGAT